MSFFEIYKDIQGYFRWRLKAHNGEIVASGEAYTTRDNATKAATYLKSWSNTTDIRQL